MLASSILVVGAYPVTEWLMYRSAKPGMRVRIPSGYLMFGTGVSNGVDRPEENTVQIRCQTPFQQARISWVRARTWTARGKVQFLGA